MVGLSRRQVGALIVSGIGITTAGCTSVRNSAGSENGPDVKWRLENVEAPAFTPNSDIAVGNERLYVSTDVGIEYIDKSTGNGLKNRGLGPSVFSSFQYLEMIGSNVFAASTGRSKRNRGWVLLDPENDDQYRLDSWETQWKPTLTAGFDGTRLAVGGEDRLEVYNLENNERMWGDSIPARTGLAAGADRIFTTVNGDTNEIYGVVVLNSNTGNARHEEAFFAPTEQSLSAPTFRNEHVYMADRQTVYAISAPGVGQWQFTLNNARFDPRRPIRFRNDRLIAGGRGGIAVLDPSTGERAWARQYEERIAGWGVTNSTVFTAQRGSGILDTVTGTKTIIHAYKLSSGEHLGWHALDTGIQRVASGTEALYVITTNNEMLALEA